MYGCCPSIPGVSWCPCPAPTPSCLTSVTSSWPRWLSGISCPLLPSVQEGGRAPLHPPSPPGHLAGHHVCLLRWLLGGQPSPWQAGGLPPCLLNLSRCWPPSAPSTTCCCPAWCGGVCATAPGTSSTPWLRARCSRGHCVTGPYFFTGTGTGTKAKTRNMTGPRLRPGPEI